MSPNIWSVLCKFDKILKNGKQYMFILVYLCSLCIDLFVLIHSHIYMCNIVFYIAKHTLHGGVFISYLWTLNQNYKCQMCWLGYKRESIIWSSVLRQYIERVQKGKRETSIGKANRSRLFESDWLCQCHLAMLCNMTKNFFLKSTTFLQVMLQSSLLCCTTWQNDIDKANRSGISGTYRLC